MRDIETLSIDELISDETIYEVWATDADGNAPDQMEVQIRLKPYIERANQLKHKGQFGEFIKAAIKAKRDFDRKAGAQNYAMTDTKTTTVTTNTGEYDFALTSYQIQNGGLFKMVQSQYAFNWVRVCHRLMVPVQLFQNIETGSERVRICYKDINGRWHDKIFPRTMLTKANSIQSLSEYGLDVNSENAKDVVKYLSEIENCNLDIIGRGISTGKFGWHAVNGERLFTPYDNQIHFDATDRFGSLAGSIRSHGDRDTWFSLIKEIRSSGRKEPNVYLVASFASVLLKAVNCLPFIVNLWTTTGRGKTVALMVACSVWADPDEGRYLTDPTSTRVALEQRLGALNHLPMMIDDLSKMKEQDESGFTKLIYYLCAGKGKERSNINLGLELTTTWKNCILTNMERPLATDEMQGGAVNRVIDFQSENGYYFEKDGHDNGNAVVGIIKNNYGFAGREFVEAIKAMTDEDLKDRFKALQTEIRRLAGSDKKEEKQIAPLALMFLADELIDDLIFKDGQRLDRSWCVDQLKSVESVSENQRAYDNFVSEVISNMSNHFDVIARDNKITRAGSERWGFYEEETNQVFVFKTQFEMIAKKHNFSTVAFCDWAFDNGISRRNGDRVRKQIKKKDPSTKLVTWFYNLSLPEDNAFITVEESDEPLPFN